VPTDPNYGRTTPPWSSVFTGQGRGVPPDRMRVSDAERHEIADALGKHFAEGRLDQSELDERVSRAMSAKTRSDFAGLLDDLPPVGAPVGAVPPGYRRRPRLAFLALVAVLALMVGASVTAPWWHVPWFLVFVLVFVFLRGPRRWWWYHHHHHGPYGPYGRYGPPPPYPPPPPGYGQPWSPGPGPRGMDMV
jgi:hypothetical protein